MAPLTTPADPPVHVWGSDAEFFGPRHDFRESLMLRRLRPLLEGRRVLDAGCGAGSLAVKLAREGLEVAAVDASEPFVEETARRLQAAGTDASRVRVSTLERLPFPDAGFDAVTCGEVLEHLEDDAAALLEIVRVLRPGGVLLVTVPAGPEKFDWVDRWAGHHRRYTTDALERALLDAGLTRIEVTPWGFPLTGLYERVVFKPMLRRRLDSGATGGPEATRGWKRRLQPVVRAALEVDRAFLGRRPGYFGLIATAHRSHDRGPA